MAEYINIENPFLAKLRQLIWKVINQGFGIQKDPENNFQENSINQYKLT